MYYFLFFVVVSLFSNFCFYHIFCFLGLASTPSSASNKITRLYCTAALNRLPELSLLIPFNCCCTHTNAYSETHCKAFLLLLLLSTVFCFCICQGAHSWIFVVVVAGMVVLLLHTCVFVWERTGLFFWLLYVFCYCCCWVCYCFEVSDLLVEMVDFWELGTVYLLLLLS